MLPAVTGLHQVSQDAVTGVTVFAWTAVDEADIYDVDVDGTPVATVPQSATPTVTIHASAGSHTLAVAPVADATAAADLAFTVPQQSGTRNPLLQAFASDAYPNMPVGSGAVRVPANLIPSTYQSMHADVSIILMDPTQPETEILPNGGFKSDHCTATSSTPLATVPMAPAFVVGAAGHNYSTAAVDSTGKTYVQGGSFCRQFAGKNANLGPNAIKGSSLYGDALGGARGGTDMDALAGTIRLGELLPGGVIAHAVAIDIDNLDNSINSWTWPATKKDSYNYGGSNKYAIPGALFVLPLNFNIAGLKSVPGKILATAFLHYGAYSGNDTKGPSIGLCTEWSEKGDVQSEFAAAYHTPFAGAGTASTWIEDVIAIFAALEVVTNNGPSTIGGGGTPIVPLSPPLA